MTGKLVVLSTCGSQAEAERIASALVEKRLAACVNVLPGVTSIYRWEGAIERATEWLLLIKTRRDLFDDLSAEIKRLHSYDVPEVVALPITNGANSYLQWIDEETAPMRGDAGGVSGR